MEIKFLLILLGVIWTALLLADSLVAALLMLVGIPFRKTFLWGLLALVISLLVLLYGWLVGRNTYEVRRVEVAARDLPVAFDGYRIVQLSDIHARSFQTRTGMLQRVVDEVNALQPDAIMFTGDLVTLNSRELAQVAPALSRLHATDGIFAVLGNHDYCLYNRDTLVTSAGERSRVIATERSWGWQVLLNESRFIRRGEQQIAVVGVENTSTSRYFFSRGDLKKAADGTDGMYRILLTHDPTHWDAEVKGHHFPLTLSGHTHATQLSVLGWCPARYTYRQYRGLYQAQQEYLYVNPGLGETLLPVRIGVSPEITMITLKAKR